LKNFIFFVLKMLGRIIDISTGISKDTPVYEGDPEPLIEKVSSLEKDGFVVSRVSIGTHTGTHVDAPSHIFGGGKTVDKLLPESFMGKAVLLDMSSGEGCITDHDLEKSYIQFADEKDIDILLIKTENYSPSSKVLGSDRMLATSAGMWIFEHGFQVVGVDTLSVDVESSLPNHHLFLSHGINIVEYLHLFGVVESVYYFICLPLKIIGCDGAPARAILLDSSFFE
jgi:arylformamidase